MVSGFENLRGANPTQNHVKKNKSHQTTLKLIFSVVDA